MLRLLKAGQPIRSVSIKGAPDLAEMHGKKAGTPTMGGILIVMSMLIPVLMWCDWTNPLTWLLIFVTFGFGTLGFLDDYLKITKKNADGLSGRYKILGQVLVEHGETFSRPCGRRLMEELLAGQGQLPDALITTSYVLLEGVFDVLQALPSGWPRRR